MRLHNVRVAAKCHHGFVFAPGGYGFCASRQDDSLDVDRQWGHVRDGGLYSLHMTDPFGYDVQISGLANNALTDG